MKGHLTCLKMALGALLWLTSLHAPAQNLDKGYELLDAARWDEANTWLVHAGAQAFARSDWDTYFESCYMLAFVATRTNDHRTLLQLAPQLEQALQRPTALAPYLYIALANARSAASSPGQALALFDRAIATVKADYPGEVAAHITALAGKALVMKQAGDFEAARLANEQALLLARESEPADPGYYRAEQARILNNLAVMHQQIGQYSLAEARYREAVARWQALNQPAASVRINLGFCFLKQNEWAKARQEFEAALAVPGLAAVEQGRAWRFLAEIFLKNGQFAPAKAALKQAETAFAGLPCVHAYRARLRMLEAGLALAEGDPARAADAYRSAWPHLVAGFEPGNTDGLPAFKAWEADAYVLELLQQQAACYLAWYRSGGQVAHLQTAWNLNERAIQLSDSMRVGLTSDASQLEMAGLFPALYQQGIGLALALAKTGSADSWDWKAFRLAAHHKAMVLREQLQRTQGRSRVWPDSVAQRFQVYKTRLADTQRAIREAQTQSEREKLQGKFFEEQSAFSRWEADLKTRYPLAFAPYTLPEFSAKAFQRQLPPDTRLFEYFWGPDSVWVFDLRASALSVRHLPAPATIYPALNPYLAFLRDPHQPVDFFVLQAGSALTDLLAPAARDTDGETWLIAPDGPLHYLPWAALPVNDNWLVKFRTVHYTASSYLLLNHPAAPARPEKAYLGVAPTYNPQRETSETSSAWGPLYFNQQEVQASGKGFGGSLLVGEKAGKTAFMAAAPGYRYLHLALHAFAPDSLSPNGGMVLAGGERLFDFEISQMALSADLVALSACETGYGPYRAGEGVMSLARAFRVAGARRVLMSHWPVNDEATAGLMQAFFSALKSGETPESALRNAQLDYLATADRSHPYYWAAFVVSGESFGHDRAHNRTWIIAGLVLAAILAGVGAIWLKKRRRKQKV